MLVTKADGTQENFNPQKLKRSLRRAGASKSEVQHITESIEALLYDGIMTQEIYREAFAMLRSSAEPSAAKYSLRRALFSLGPTGFPFEDFLARLYEIEGYQTKVRIFLSGKCASHEIDVAGHSEKHSFITEAKFHARPGVKSDLKDVMYSYARFLDLKAEPVCKEDVCGIDTIVVATNTKFTHTAEKYAECNGMQLLSWTYPKGNTLQDRVEKARMYPITVLTTLTNGQKRVLIENIVILCRDLLSNQHVLKDLGMSKNKIQAVINEASQLCEG